MKARMKKRKMSRVKNTCCCSCGGKYEQTKQEMIVSVNGKSSYESYIKLLRVNTDEIYRGEHRERLYTLYGLMVMIQKYRQKRVSTYN
jgi:hypothetical protein